MTPSVFACSLGRVALLDLGCSIIEHAHPHAQILVKISGPDRRIPIAGTVHVLSDTNAIFLEPWAPHAGVPDNGGTPTRILAFDIDTAPSNVATQRTFHRDGMQGRRIILPRALRDAVIEFHFRMEAGLATQEQADALIDLLSGLCRMNAVERSRAAALDYRIRRVINSVQSNPALGNNLSDCAQLAGLSRQHFFFLFRSSTGMSPRLFCNSVRLETAVRTLLDETTLIGSISSRLGFSAPSHFTRFFLQHLGATPRRFREGARLLTQR